MYFYSVIKKSFLIIFILAVAANLSVVVNAEEDASKKIIEVIGTSTISGNDIAKARDQAIKNSLVSAVELAVADLLPIESMIQNFETLNKILYDNSSEFVEYYKVLTELESGKTYRVLVQATVSTSVIEQQLMSAGIKVCKKNMPNILFFIAEQNLGDILPQYWWTEDLGSVRGYSETAMAESMIRNGFFVIDQKSLIKNKAFEAVKYKPDLSNQEAVSLGNSLHADVVIAGSSKADIAPNTMGENIKSFKGIVSARALRTDTGEEIASTVQTAASVNKDNVEGGRDALLNAGYLAGSDLSLQIVNKWQKEVKKPLTTFVIIVEGTRYLSNFAVFRSVLNEIPGVITAQTSEMKADEATIIVNFQGNAKELADALMLKNFESFGINIYEISQSHLRVRLISR
ncbi:MAG: hypothetical protein KKD50_08120 [Proteobacteria bacterium]|nr:hypothetical protein [Pseudomonadota bacterium]